MTAIMRGNLALGSDSECALLYFPFKSQLKYIFIISRVGREHLCQINRGIPSQRGCVDLVQAIVFIRTVMIINISKVYSNHQLFKNNTLIFVGVVCIFLKNWKGGINLCKRFWAAPILHISLSVKMGIVLGAYTQSYVP